MALKAESAIATVALRQVEKSEGGKEGSMMNESLVVLAQFSLTRAEIGSFRQLKTSTREKDYCTCLFEQPQEVEGEDEDEEEDSSEISATSGAVACNEYYRLLDLSGFPAIPRLCDDYLRHIFHITIITISY
ncbi:hypothetical protein BGZ97_012917 [Linnemannia gamsii]|uniref:Uncharacterized protein n=1 Tax=Linnemannia gamsii TaxID=64522 RepID=A0A9P6UL69_9FUNG|nr:hypothetical protein BGZ97_012917 [Linnemannia gamsii]